MLSTKIIFWVRKFKVDICSDESVFQTNPLRFLKLSCTIRFLLECECGKVHTVEFNEGKHTRKFGNRKMKERYK